MKTLSFILLFALSTCTFAQFNDDKKGQLGILGGWNCSNISAAELQSTTSNGFYGGLIWEHKIIPLIRMQSGLLFVQNGYSLEGLPDYKYTTLNYLQVPIIAKLKVGPVYFMGGLTSALRVGGAAKYEDETIKVTSDDFKSYDFGAQVGLGFQILIIGIEARYTWGLTDIANSGAEINNQAFSLGAHIHLF
jgi:hypothetical protein